MSALPFSGLFKCSRILQLHCPDILFMRTHPNLIIVLLKLQASELNGPCPGFGLGRAKLDAPVLLKVTNESPQHPADSPLSHQSQGLSPDSLSDLSDLPEQPQRTTSTFSSVKWVPCIHLLHSTCYEAQMRYCP